MTERSGSLSLKTRPRRIRPRADPGFLLTKPMSIEHGMIEVNVESHFSSDNDSLRVAIRDTMGDDIADIRLKTAS